MQECGWWLIDFVYDTVQRSRKRSLREMWLMVSEAVDDGEVIRQRVLEYLTEGSVTPAILELSERPSFAFSDWASCWERIVTVEDAREWRATAARLLGSYPDHPGLLASRGLSEALIPDGDTEEFERNLEQSFRQAQDRYKAADTDIAEMVEWVLKILVGSNAMDGDGANEDGANEDRMNEDGIGKGGMDGNGTNDKVEPWAGAEMLSLRRLVEQGPMPPLGLAAGIVISCARAGIRRVTDSWLAANWRRSSGLAILKLADTLDAASTFQDAIQARYAETMHTQRHAQTTRIRENSR